MFVEKHVSSRFTRCTRDDDNGGKNAHKNRLFEKQMLEKEN